MIAAPLDAAALTSLLGRAIRARLTPADRRAFHARRVLITGAGGSIGSELARTIAECRPSQIGLLDHSEYHLVQIEREVRARWPGVQVVACLADVTREAQLRKAFRRVEPDAVYHAAACKHVTIAEREVSVAADVNVVGTAIVAQAAADAGTRFVLISSDKAAAPESVMGATKRLAELVTLSRASATFRPVIVRFGNVLGSSGSVVEVMRGCIHAGRPIPITDPDATRYFMTAGEAVALVVRADRIATAAETFWLDMGDPVRVGDLAARVIELEQAAGHASPGVSIVGLGPGEKRHEQLADPCLVFRRAADRRLWCADAQAVDRVEIDRMLLQLRRAVRQADDAAALDVITTAVAGFSPSAAARHGATWVPDNPRDGRAA